MQKHILLIEDNLHLIETVRTRLESAGYKISVAVDGKEGLDKAWGLSPDLIILDLMLPKLDGYKICRILKFDKRYSHIPIILFSAKGQLEDIKLGGQVGADAYVTKPFDPKSLMKKITELIG